MQYVVKLEVTLQKYIGVEGKSEEEVLDLVESEIKELYGASLKSYDIKAKVKEVE